MPDYNSIIRSPLFQFLVGEKQTCLSIHAALVDGISAPLSALIKNGKMKESLFKTAVLEHVEENTFIGFCEYAYNERYVTPDIAEPQEEVGDSSLQLTTEEIEDDALARASIGGIGDSQKVEEDSLVQTIIDDMDHPKKKQEYSWFPPSVGHDVDDDYYSQWGITKTKKDRKKSEIYITSSSSKPKPPPSSLEPPITQMCNQFQKEFRDKFFPGTEASKAAKPDILFHGKMYAFATEYLIGGLRLQSLKSLHRDLCSFSVDANTATQIFDLIEYSYTTTGPIEPGGDSSLRKLVIHYLACKAHLLARLDPSGLRTLLTNHGELGADLALKIVS